MKQRILLAVRRSSRAVNGFTLVEMIVTLTIFVILTASVFGIMTAVFQSSNGLQANQNRKDEVSAFHSFLQENFQNFGAADHFVTYRRDGEGKPVSGVILGTRGTLFALDAVPQPNGLFGLRLGRLPEGDLADPVPTVETFMQKVTKNQSAINWTPLIKDVHAISWRFQGVSSPTWQPDWTSADTKPALIECSLQIAGEERALPMDFHLPRLVAPSAGASPPDVAHAP